MATGFCLGALLYKKISNRKKDEISFSRKLLLKNQFYSLLRARESKFVPLLSHLPQAWRDIGIRFSVSSSVCRHLRPP